MELRAEDLTPGSPASNSSALHLFVFPDDSQISEDDHGYGILLKEEVKRTTIWGHHNGEMTCRPSMKSRNESTWARAAQLKRPLSLAIPLLIIPSMADSHHFRPADVFFA